MKTAIINFNSSLHTELMDSYEDLYTINLEVYIGETVVTDYKLPELFSLSEKSSVIPKTSQPQTGKIHSVVKEVLDKYELIVVVAPHHSLTGTYQNFNIVYNDLSEDEQNKFIVIETNSLALSESIICEYAIKLIRTNHTKEEIKNELEANIHKIITFVVPGSLRYLQKSGRVALTKALLGQMMNLRLIVRSYDGDTGVYKKVRGFKQLVKALVEEADIETVKEVVFGSIGAAEKEYFKVKEEVEEVAKIRDIGVASSVIGAHFGPNSFGMAVILKNDK